VKISDEIGVFTSLTQLWLNDNPLREIPVAMSNCKMLQELDLKNTFVISLPKELAECKHLTYLNLDGCPLDEKLDETYKTGIDSMHQSFQKKNSRKHFKEELFKSLTEWKYPSEDKKAVFDVVQDVFKALKTNDLDNKEIMKMLCRNFQIVFPVKLEMVDSELICRKLEGLHEESLMRTQKC
jgi:Leucine-rich repeat (LRR) protein